MDARRRTAVILYALFVLLALGLAVMSSPLWLVVAGLGAVALSLQVRRYR